MDRRRFFKWTGGIGALLAGGGTYSSMSNSLYSGPPSDHFDGVRFFVPGEPPLGSFANLLKWQLGNDARAAWPDVQVSPFADLPPPAVEPGKLRSTLIGHASFLIHVSGFNILVDPLYSQRASPVSFAGPKRVNEPGIAFDKLPRIDAVLVTHGHYDHLDNVTLGRINQAHRPKFICPLPMMQSWQAPLAGRTRRRRLIGGRACNLGKVFPFILCRPIIGRRAVSWTGGNRCGDLS